jgi:hypothetical protein
MAARLTLDVSTPPLERDKWAVERALARPEVWALVAEHIPGLVAKWRLLGVCKASRVGVKESLGTRYTRALARGGGWRMTWRVQGDASGGGGGAANRVYTRRRSVVAGGAGQRCARGVRRANLW